MEKRKKSELSLVFQDYTDKENVDVLKQYATFMSTVVGLDGNYSSLVNSQAAVVHTHPGLPQLPRLFQKHRQLTNVIEMFH